MTTMGINYLEQQEKRRTDLRNEELKAQQNEETMRTNLVNESIKQGTLDESIRANKARESEAERSNKAREAETMRSDLERERETRSMNDRTIERRAREARANTLTQRALNAPGAVASRYFNAADAVLTGDPKAHNDLIGYVYGTNPVYQKISYGAEGLLKTMQNLLGSSVVGTAIKTLAK